MTNATEVSLFWYTWYKSVINAMKDRWINNSSYIMSVILIGLIVLLTCGAFFGLPVCMVSWGQGGIWHWHLEYIHHPGFLSVFWIVPATTLTFLLSLWILLSNKQCILCLSCQARFPLDSGRSSTQGHSFTGMIPSNHLSSGTCLPTPCSLASRCQFRWSVSIFQPTLPP